MLPFIVSRGISPVEKKVSDREFYWSADHEFHSRFYSRVYNCKSVWSADKFVRKLMLLGKNESPFFEKKKKNSFTEGFFSSKSKSSEKKESLQDEGSDTKFSYQVLP